MSWKDFIETVVFILIFLGAIAAFIRAMNKL